MIMYLEFIMCIDVKCMKITCVCVCVCVCVYTHRVRERQTESEGQRDRERESCMTHLHILESKPLLVASFANIFSDYEGGHSSCL